MAEVACLISVRLFHRVQQQFPGFIVYLNFALALLGQFEGLLRLTQPVGRYGATDLLQLSLCGESLLSRDVSLRRTFSEVSIANLSLFGGYGALGLRKRVVFRLGLLEPLLGGWERRSINVPFSFA